MSSPHYQYSKLDEAGRQIRLVHILPGAWADPVSCQLNTASLDSYPTYQTLSYVWGDPNITKPIDLDGCIFNVTLNLHAALRRLRCVVDIRVIWVDAICINQKDLDERTQQVALMDKIYKRCSEVLMWVGDWKGDERSIEQGASQFQSIVQAGNKYWVDSDDPTDGRRSILDAVALLYIISTNNHLKFMPLEEAETRCRSGFEAIGSIFSMPYWTRIWVIQEIALPPLATIIYGSISIPWETVAHVSNYWTFHTETCCITDNFRFRKIWKNSMLGLLIAISKIEFIRSKVQRGLLLDLSYLLWLHVTLHASDPLDNVYALFSLARKEGGPLRQFLPNYNRDWRELYQDLTLTIIRSKEDLTLLSRESLHDDLHDDTLPSWVFNWRLSPDGHIWNTENHRQTTYDLYAAARQRRCVVDLYQRAMLRVEGNRVDKIQAVSREGWKKVPSDLIANFSETLERAGVQYEPERDYIGGGTWEDAYWRTVCGDHFISRNGDLNKVTARSARRRCNPEDKQSYRSWMKWKRTENPLESNDGVSRVYDMYRATMVAMHGRRSFVTQQGYLGIGPETTAVGDEVYVINGSRVPFVLRRVESSAPADSPSIEGNDENYPRFQLVGGCYVHGIMDGEACDEATGVKASSLLLC